MKSRGVLARARVKQSRVREKASIHATQIMSAVFALSEEVEEGEVERGKVTYEPLRTSDKRKVLNELTAR